MVRGGLSEEATFMLTPKELEAGEGRMVRLASRGVGRSQSLTEKTDCSPGHEMNLREQAWA